MIPGRLTASLAKIVAAAPADHDWWLIGSVAAKLSGIDLDPQDVDVMASKSTIDMFIANLGGGAILGAENDRFRSTPFCRVDVPDGLPIELMGDLHVRHDGLWQPLIVHTRVAVDTPSGRVYIPSLDEQADIFERFGRPKDLAKAALIRVSGR